MLDESLSAQFDALMAQFGAAQAQIVALRVSVEAWQPVPQERPPCPHLNKKDAGGTLGHPLEKCLDCGDLVES